MRVRFPSFHHVVAAFATAIFAAAVPAASDPAADSAREQLFADLADPEGEAWMRAESDILRLWSQSGSAPVDAITRRGEGALDLGDPESAIGHLNAATDHAPDFAQGFYLRGTAFYMTGAYGQAAADFARALTLEPRHFLTLTQLGSMLAEMGNEQAALEAFRASLAIHPHQREALDAVDILDRVTGGRAI